jgi:hypothetical protein
MSWRGSVAAFTACVAVAAPASGVSASTPGAAPPRCDSFAIAPDVQLAPAMMCVRRVTLGGGPPNTTSERIIVSVSRDEGRTWQARSGNGLPNAPQIGAVPSPDNGVGVVGSTPAQVFYSAGYATDHAVYLSVVGQEEGLFLSLDDGNTWAPAAVVTAPGSRFTPYVDTRSVTNGSSLSRYPIAVPASPGPQRLDPPASRIESGAGGDTDQRFDFADGVLFDEAWKPGSGPGDFDVFSKSTSSLHACTLDLDCTRTLHVFPQGTMFDEVALTGNFSHSHRLFVVTTDASHIDQMRVPFGVLTSADGGRHLAPLRWWARLARQAHRVGGELDGPPTFATNAKQGARVAVYVGFQCVTDACQAKQQPPIPGERIFFSGDGRHFQQVFAARGWWQVGSRSRPAWGDEMVAGLVMGPDGHLYLEASPHAKPSSEFSVRPSFDVWCSTDLGSHWATRCRK